MMRKIAFAAALVAGFAGAAHAQSSVTVYGRLNVSLESQENITVPTGEKVALQNNSSRIGFKGSEDLGGGLKANFLLEHGFSPDTGAAAAPFWGRESWVGLSGNFGAVRLGNMGPTAAYFATADYISMHNHDTGTSSDMLYAGVGIPLTNAIAYTSPSFGGLTVEAQAGLRENTGAPENTYVLAANWVGGPLHLGAGLVDQGPAWEATVRALYELGPVTLGAYVSRDDDGGTGAGSGTANKYRLAAMYTMGASEFHANVGFADERGNTANTDAMQYTVAYNYNLSKRTKLYAFYTKVDNEAAAGYFAPAAGVDPSSLAIGVRHNF